jgi:hypothetical protein
LRRFAALLTLPRAEGALPADGLAVEVEPVAIEPHQLPARGVSGAASPSAVEVETIAPHERPASPRAGGGGGPVRIEPVQLPARGVSGAASPSAVEVETIAPHERAASPRAGGGGGPVRIEPVRIERIEPHQLPARGGDRRGLALGASGGRDRRGPAVEVAP